MSYIIKRSFQLKSKISRNDPCPCGSGKKYKKCCLLKNENENLTPHLKEGYIKKAIDWITKQNHLSQALTDLFDEFLKDKKEVGEYEVRPLMDVFLFDYQVAGKTPLAHFINHALLPSDEKKMYQNWLKYSKFGIFEVGEINLGMNVIITELDGSKTYKVLERMGTYGLEKGVIVFARLLPLDDDNWMFSGGLLYTYPKEAVFSLKGVASLGMKGKMTGYDFLKIMHKKEDGGRKSFKTIKNELERHLEKTGKSFDFNNIEKRIETAKSPNDVFASLLNSPFSTREEFEKTASLVTSLWNAHPRINQNDKKTAPGPLESRLINQMVNEYHQAVKKNNWDQKSAQKYWDSFHDNWLDKPLKKLSFQTPREAILEERRQLDNPNTSIKYRLDIMGHMESENEMTHAYNHAVDTLKKKRWRLGDKMLSAFIKKYPAFPDIFRAYANLAKAKEMQGDISTAQKLLKKALEINPHYELAQKGLSALSRIKKRTRRVMKLLSNEMRKNVNDKIIDGSI